MARTVRATAEEVHEATERAERAGAEKTRAEVAKEFSLEALEIKDIQEKLEAVIQQAASDNEKFANVTDAAGKSRRSIEQQLLASQGKALIKYIEGFNPATDEEDAKAYWSFLHIDASQYSGAEEVEMARDKKREEQEAVLNAFRRSMHEVAGDLVWLAQQDNRETGLIMLGIMDSVLSQGGDISRFKQRFEEDFGYIEESKKQALYAAVEKKGKKGPIPFKDFVKRHFGENPTDGRRLGINGNVEQIEDDRKADHREFIQALMDVLPSAQPGEQRWNVKPDVAEIPNISTPKGKQAAEMWGEDWEKRREKRGGPPAELPVTEQIAEKKGIWFLKFDTTHRTEQYSKMKKGYTWVRRPDGKLEQMQVEYASIVTAKEVPASFLAGGPQLGKVMERKDDWVKVSIQEYTATDIVTAVDLVRRFQIPPAKEMENGHVGIPRTVRTPDGEWVETWDVLKEDFRQQALEMFQRSQRNFERLGFDYEAEKKKQEMANKRQYRWANDTAPRETSAIEYEVARITVHQEMKRAAAEAQADPELAHLAPLIRQAQEGLKTLYRSMEDFGRVKVYESLARDRAQARLRGEGLTPGSAEWAARYEDVLAEEFVLVAEYYSQQAVELKRLAEETMDDKSAYDQASAEQRVEMKKARLEKFANIDVEAQTKIVTEVAINSPETKGALGIVSESDEDIAEEVATKMSVLRRPLESNASAQHRLDVATDEFSDAAEEATNNLAHNIPDRFARAIPELVRTEVDIMQMQGATPEEVVQRAEQISQEYVTLGTAYLQTVENNVLPWQERLLRQRPGDFRSDDIIAGQTRILAQLSLHRRITLQQADQLRYNQDRQNVAIVVANLRDGIERMQEFTDFGVDVREQNGMEQKLEWDALRLAQEMKDFNQRHATPM